MALLIIPGKEETFVVLTCGPELEVCKATYGPGIDQSQHARSVSQPYDKISYFSGHLFFPVKCFVSYNFVCYVAQTFSDT